MELKIASVEVSQRRNGVNWEGYPEEEFHCKPNRPMVYIFEGMSTLSTSENLDCKRLHDWKYRTWIAKGSMIGSTETSGSKSSKAEEGFEDFAGGNSSHHSGRV